MSWWQRAKTGSQGTIIQAQNYYEASRNGLTDVDIAQVESISREVIKTELANFDETALQTLKQRFDEFTFNYIERQSAAPEGFEALKSPFMQRALRTAKIEFGAKGNTETGESLVEMLVKLSVTDPESLLAICLDQALSIVPKLTKGQVAALTAIFMVTSVHVRNVKIDTHYAYLRQLIPLVSLIPDDQISYRHMQFAQVGWINPNSVPYPTFGRAILQNSPGLYTAGVAADSGEVPEPLRTLNPPIYVRHEKHSNRVRLRAVHPDDIADLVREHPIVRPWKDSLEQQMMRSRLSETETEEQLIAEIPELERLISVWKTSEISRFELTSIGMVIAHTNWERMADGKNIPSLASLFPSP